VCQTAIKHLTSEEALPRNNKSTNAALRRIIFVNENLTPLNDDSILVFPDIVKMYPSTDVVQAVDQVEDKHRGNPDEHGFSTNCVVKALRICNSCNCIEFNGKYYLPCRGCATGPAHACELTDVWIGSITEKHLQTCPVETVHFSIYRDDGLDILPGGENDLPALVQHFDSLHPNLDWEFKHGKEGAYLDLLVMLKDGKIETKIFTKSEPVYVGPTSCHDPKVFKSIFKGVGLRIRLNCSNDEDFDNAVESYSKSLAISGYKYQTAKTELRKCRDLDRIEYLKKEPERKKNSKKKNNKKVFWISTFDPRIPHPRQVLTKNYPILEGDPIAREVFERKNLVAGSKRGRNLQELISPTVQQHKTSSQPMGPKLPKGSYQCKNLKKEESVNYALI
jgi:hypothetical protein